VDFQTEPLSEPRQRGQCGRLITASSRATYGCNAYLQDRHEYWTTTRNLLQLGAAINYLPHGITVRLH
jgi:hypothetical protein